ncbi:hypothetical protein GW17_00061424, partial [Ensete ventricosum]
MRKKEKKKKKKKKKKKQSEKNSSLARAALPRPYTICRVAVHSSLPPRGSTSFSPCGSASFSRRAVPLLSPRFFSFFRRAVPLLSLCEETNETTLPQR